MWKEIQKSEDKNEERLLRAKAREFEKKLHGFSFPKSHEITDLTEMIKSENAKEHQKIEGMLNSFYENRDRGDESELILDIGGFGNIRLQSRGAEIQEKETDENKTVERLHKFQEEMNAFTEFLKGVFFNS